MLRAYHTLARLVWPVNCRGARIATLVGLSLEIDPKGCSAGMVRGAVGTVDGRIGAAGDGASIEEKRLVEDIQAH